MQKEGKKCRFEERGEICLSSLVFVCLPSSLSRSAFGFLSAQGPGVGLQVLGPPLLSPSAASRGSFFFDRECGSPGSPLDGTVSLLGKLWVYSPCRCTTCLDLFQLISSSAWFLMNWLSVSRRGQSKRVSSFLPGVDGSPVCKQTLGGVLIPFCCTDF